MCTMRTTSWRDTTLIPLMRQGPPESQLVYCRGQGIDGRRLQLGDVGRDGDTLEVGFLDRLVGIHEEHCDRALLADLATRKGATHYSTQGVLVGLCDVALLGDVCADLRLRQAEV